MMKFETILNRIFSAVLTVLFSIIVILTILLVILRYVFNTGITGGNEMLEFLFLYTTAIGAAVSIGTHEHIRIGVFTDNLPVPAKAAVEIIGIVLIAVLNIVFIKYSLPWISKVGTSESPVLRIPMKYIQMSVPLSCGMSILYCFFNIFKIRIRGAQR